MTWGAIKRDSLDALFSDYIRHRAKWKCERCLRDFSGRRQSLHASHFYGRRAQSTRFLPENADSLCSGCHRIFGENPADYREWKIKKLGEPRFNLLTLKAKMEIGKKQDRTMIKIWLKQEMEKLKKNERNSTPT